MKYGKIEVLSYPANVQIWAGIDEEHGRMVSMECSGDCPQYGYTRSAELASHIRGLSRRGQIEFIKRHQFAP